MQKTTNYNLNKPEVSDPLRVEDFNQNSDVIDAALKKLNTAVGAAGNCSIECGTYKGTGTFGEDNPNTLTFGIQPKVVFIFITSSYGALAHTSASGNYFNTTNQVFYYGGSTFRVYQSEHKATNYTMSGNVLSWYNTLSASAQMNGSNTTYGYITIG